MIFLFICQMQSGGMIGWQKFYTEHSWLYRCKQVSIFPLDNPSFKESIHNFIIFHFVLTVKIKIDCLFKPITLHRNFLLTPFD